MTSHEKAINLWYLFLTYKPEKNEKPINTFTSFFWMYWYVSIFQKSIFDPNTCTIPKSPNNGFRWCPLGKLSHLGLEQLRRRDYSGVEVASTWGVILGMPVHRRSCWVRRWRIGKDGSGCWQEWHANTTAHLHLPIEFPPTGVHLSTAHHSGTRREL